MQKSTDAGEIGHLAKMIFTELDQCNDGAVKKNEITKFVHRIAIAITSEEDRNAVIAASKLRLLKCPPEGIKMQQFADFYVTQSTSKS